MKSILTSKWFALAAGILTSVAVVLFYPSSPTTTPTSAGGTNAVHGTNGVAATHDAAPATATPAEDEHAVPVVTPLKLTSLGGNIGEPGSLTFNNPDLNAMIEELKREKTALLAKERELQELKRRIDLEKTEFGSMTSEVFQFKAALERTLTNQLTMIYRSETNKLQQLADIYTNMPPHNAVEILNNMTVDDVAKILEFMPERNKALILENFATNHVTKASGKATDISQRMRRLSAEIVLPELKK